jgi:hypothetical protein
MKLNSAPADQKRLSFNCFKASREYVHKIRSRRASDVESAPQIGKLFDLLCISFLSTYRF